MSTVTNIRERTLSMLTAIGVEVDYSNERIIERYVRWVDNMEKMAYAEGIKDGWEDPFSDFKMRHMEGLK